MLKYNMWQILTNPFSGRECMKIYIIGLLLTAYGLLVMGCTDRETALGHKIEVSSYIEDAVDVDNVASLDIINETGNIEIYVWNKEHVKFEITKKIRGSEEKEALKEKLEDFEAKISESQNKVVFMSEYKGNAVNLADRSLDLKVFIPKDTRSIYCKVDLGTIRVFDDLRSDFKAEVKTVNVDINKIEGKVNLEGDMGNLNIYEGLLKRGSSARVNFGNITIKAAFEEGSEYSFETGVGNLELKLPEKSKVFIQGLGNVEVNEFDDDSYSTRVRLNSGMGRIVAVKS